MRRKTRGGFMTALLAMVLFGSPQGAAPAGEPERVPAGSVIRDTSWGGTILLEGQVTVPAGVTLNISPGTTVLFGKASSLVVMGSLLAPGSAQGPVTFGPDPGSGSGGGWEGITVTGDGATVRCTYCRWRGATRGLTVKGAAAELANSAFEGCDLGLDAQVDARISLTGCLFKGNKAGAEAQLRTSLTIADSTFEDNTDHALRVQNQAGAGKITGCTFRGGETGLILNRARDILLSANTFTGVRLGLAVDQVGSDIRLSGNTFEKGAVGVRILRLANPWVACCRFLGLETGIVTERFSNPMVVNNLFEGNGTALSVLQKCDFPVRRNVFRDNKRGIFLDLSAYPVIHENDFEGNARDIVLGINMSADYEHRVGTGKVTRQYAEQSQSRKMEQLEKNGYVDFVDASDNWWGEVTTRLMEKEGADANIATIEDRHDTPEISYPGWAEGSYRMDRVLFDRWRKAPVPGAGPLPGGCGDLQDSDRGLPRPGG